MRMNRTEEQIISHWSQEFDRPMVSVCCLAYNHEHYVAQTLDSILAQVTNFPIEVLINDDASQDSTTEIIKRYERLYPKIVKPIYQRENQYSSGILMNPTINFPRARGKYIALCECDDFWTLDSKLQRQYEFMERQTDVSVYFHPVIELNLATGTSEIVCNHYSDSQVVSLQDVVSGRGAYMPTPSLFFRASLLRNKLSWFESDWPVGDFFLQVILGFYGSIYYDHRVMATYRRNAPGSWTSSMQSDTKRLNYNVRMGGGILRLFRLLKHARSRHILAVPYSYYYLGGIDKSQGIFAVFCKVVFPEMLISTNIRFIILYYKEVTFKASAVLRKKLKTGWRFLITRFSR